MTQAMVFVSAIAFHSGIVSSVASQGPGLASSPSRNGRNRIPVNPRSRQCRSAAGAAAPRGSITHTPRNLSGKRWRQAAMYELSQ